MGELQNCSFKQLLSQNVCLDNYSMSVSDSNSDSNSKFMKLVIFVFFILYLRSSK